MQFVASLAELLFTFPGDIEACLFADCIGHRNPSERTCEADLPAFDHYIGISVQSAGYPFEHLFDELHHPDVVFVGDVDLHDGELRIVGPVHAFVPEVLAEFINAVESSDNQPFQIEFIGDSQIERNVQRIVVGDERAGRCSTGYGLQDRSFNLEVSAFVEEFAHRIDDFRPIDEYLLDLRVDDQVDVSLAVAQFGIAEGVVHLSVLLLDDRQRAERFAEQFELLAVYRELSGFGQEDKSFDSYDITYVEQLLEDLVV